jgi:hypothetical protein
VLVPAPRAYGHATQSLLQRYVIIDAHAKNVAPNKTLSAEKVIFEQSSDSPARIKYLLMYLSLICTLIPSSGGAEEPSESVYVRNKIQQGCRDRCRLLDAHQPLKRPLRVSKKILS